jgi:hypothetical protein
MAMEATGPETQEPQEPQTDPPAAERREGEQAYVVQVRDESDQARDLDRPRWFDVGTVHVPPRTKRRTVIEKALARADAEIFRPKPKQPRAYRVLDAESAEVIPGELYQPPAPEPELRIG